MRSTFKQKLIANIKDYKFLKKSLFEAFTDFIIFRQIGLFGNTPRTCPCLMPIPDNLWYTVDAKMGHLDAEKSNV
jgi:hypothetical protein